LILRTLLVSTAVAFACTADATAGVSAAGNAFALLVGIAVVLLLAFGAAFFVLSRKRII